MKGETRRQQIMDHLMEVGTASLEDFAEQFAVSRMTIHRDLDQLEREGLLRKVRGGATIQSNAQFESDFRYRKRLAVEEKRALARAALDKIQPGQAVIIDDGSTTGGIAPLLVERRPLTVITNNAAAIATLTEIGGIKLIALGGEYNRRFHGFFGLGAEQALRGLRADLAFLSTSAVQGAVAFHQDQEIVKTKRAIMEAARRRYLLVDHTKFERTALNLLADLTSFDAVVTGETPSVAARNALSQAGVMLEVVGPSFKVA